MAESNIDSKMMNLNLNKKTDINILLLGSTGVGKSTLINSFANYLTYGQLKHAKKDKLMVLIPSQLTVIDKFGEYHIISTGDTDKNEYLQTDESATQDVKTYVFPMWNGQINVRLIDTPGMGDTRGVEQDDINSENILSYISNLHELHAICYLLKPNESRNTVFFNYCINQIFSRLDKSASDNIIFCFTNTRGTDYNQGETIGILKRTVEEIASRPPFAKIPFDKNIFCFDNEPFRYLAAIKNNIELSSEVKERNKESWEKSSVQCWKLIHYIIGDKDSKPLKPHFVKSTNAINEARRMINQLSKPLAEIMELINHNTAVLERLYLFTKNLLDPDLIKLVVCKIKHRELLEQDNASLEEMKSKLYITVITLDVTQMEKPATVCTSRKCSDIIQIAGKNVWTYKQRCHDPCYCLKNVGKEVLGDPALVSCAAMNNTNTCSQCYCDYRVHMHIYYTTKPVEKKEKDENMQKKITNRSEVMENKQKLIRDMQKKQSELSLEHKTIVETCAKFAHFLQNNAITPFSDSYKEYIEYLIDEGKSCDMETVKHLQQLLEQYVEFKNRFDEALRLTKTVGREELVTSKEINDSVQILYNLKHNGAKIRELYNCQKKAKSKEFQDTEYVHNVSHNQNEKKENDRKEKKSKSRKDKKEKRSDTNDEKRDKKGDRTVEKKDKKEKKGDANDGKKSDTRKPQNKGSARHDSPPPSYQETQRNQRPNRFPSNRGHSNQFNQFPNAFPSSSQMGPIPPLMNHTANQNLSGNWQDRQHPDYKINLSVQVPPNNAQFSPNMNPPFQQNMNPPFSQNMNQPFSQNMNPPFSQNMNQPFSQNMNPPFSQNMNPPFSQNMNQPFSQNMNPPFSQNMNQPFSQNMNPPFSQNMNQPFSQNMNQPFSQNMNPPFSQNMNQPFSQNMYQPFPTNKNQPFPTNMNQPFPTNMNHSFSSDHRHGINWHNNAGNQPRSRNNEQGRFRDNRGRGKGNKQKNSR